MIEKNLLDMVSPKNNRKRMKAIVTSTSTKIRPWRRNGSIDENSPQSFQKSPWIWTNWNH